MVSRSNYQVCLALSTVAFALTGLNYIDNEPLAITSMVLFILTEIVFFIKNIPNIRSVWTGLLSCEFVCVAANLLSAVLCVSYVFINCLVSRSFYFNKILPHLSSPVICSAFLLYNYGSYIIYDIESTVRMLIGRLASPPSMDCDIALVELTNGGVIRAYLPKYSKVDQKCPKYSKVDQKCPKYSLYDGDPPVYGDVLFNDGSPLEVEPLLGDGEEVSVWSRCMNSVFSGIPSFGASRNHRVIERSEVGQVSVDMETGL